MNETEAKELINKELAKYAETMKQLQSQNLALAREVAELSEVNRQLRDAGATGMGGLNQHSARLGGRNNRAMLNEMLPMRLEAASLEEIVEACVGPEIYNNDAKWQAHVKNTKTPLAVHEK